MRLTDEQIGAGLHALREAPSEEFAAELDAWASEGFPSVKQLAEPHAASPQRRHRKGFLGFVMRRPALSALAGATAVVLIVGLSVAAYLGSHSAVSTDSRGGSPLHSVPFESNGSAKSGSVPQSALAGGAQLEAQSRPHNGHPTVQERSASLELSTDAGKLEDTANGVVQVTERYDGIVDFSTVHAAGSNGHASYSLRIPTQHLNDAMTDLSNLGRVTTRDTGSSNVTGAYVDAGKAYADARAKVDSLLEQLRTASPSEAPAIRLQLDTARQQLAAARAALRGLKQHVAYTPVTVQITVQGDGNWSIGDAAGEAVTVLEAIGGALLIALAVAVPLGALLALSWLGVRELRRRRRESPLDR